MVKCNGLDLKLFQFDYDLTFAVFFLNADRTIYARYGTRSSHDGDRDVSVSGFVETMQAVLDIHKNYPANGKALSHLQAKPISRGVPEDYPALDHFQSTLDYDGQVSKSCIHCHQIRDAARLEYRVANQPLPKNLLYPFPTPRVIGLNFDKNSRATVASVIQDSPADLAKLRAGDQIRTFDGQLISSEADFQWMLHNLEPVNAKFELEVTRAGNPVVCSVSLPDVWRESTDLSWRPTRWDMRCMATGGMTLVPLTAQQRQQSGIPNEQMGLMANHVGMYGAHARARKAGLRKGDIITAFDQRSDLMTEGALLSYALRQKRSGDVVEIEYQRNGKTRTTKLRLQ